MFIFLLGQTLKILWCIVDIIAKKLKFESQDPILNIFQGNFPKTMLFRSSDFFLPFYLTLLKNAPEYIDPFGHFVSYEISNLFDLTSFT